MKYQEKIKHAEKAASELMVGIPLDQIRKQLQGIGLYNSDIDNVVASARNIIGEKYKPQIREKLLARENLSNAEEFKDIDAPTLQRLAKQEANAIANEEKRKVAKLLKEGKEPLEILQSIRTDFYPEEKVAHQIAALTEVRKQNSFGGRFLNIGGGLILMLIGGGMSYASMQSSSGGRLFYGLVIVGLVMLVKGLITAPDPD